MPLLLLWVDPDAALTTDANLNTSTEGLIRMKKNRTIKKLLKHSTPQRPRHCLPCHQSKHPADKGPAPCHLAKSSRILSPQDHRASVQATELRLLWVPGANSSPRWHGDGGDLTQSVSQLDFVYQAGLGRELLSFLSIACGCWASVKVGVRWGGEGLG